MNELKLGQNITHYRRKNNMTQDQLASYMGVSKSSVSKWETNTTFPDITLLPQLATLFNISLDELIGYVPQLSKKAIIDLYHQLAEEVIVDPLLTLEHCHSLTRTYYACFDFLYYLATFYLNHYMLFENSTAILEEAIALCQRIEKESENPSLVKDALSLEILILVCLHKPHEVLDILGENPKPLGQESEVIGTAFQMIGNLEKANEIFQISIYQHLLMFLQDSMLLMQVNIQNYDYCEETIHRVFQILDIYHIDTLHFHTAVQIYLSAAMFYATYQKQEETLDMLNKYITAIQKVQPEFYLLHGDHYFNKIDPWLDQLMLGANTPRGSQLIQDDLISVIENPIFDFLHENNRFQVYKKHLYQLKESHL